MHPILYKVVRFLSEANLHAVEIDDQLIEDFGEACKASLRRQFTEDRKDGFTLRMSSIGRPLCQLQMEREGASREPPPYNLKMRFIFGDMIEALAMCILKASGVNVQSEQVKVSTEIADEVIEGTYDLEIDNEIWDIKSASPYSFKYKFGEQGGFGAIAKENSFGYLPQGYLYAEGSGKKFAGLIAIDKSSGEWALTEVPPGDSEYKEAALSTVKKNITAIKKKEPFRRLFSDVAEKFRKSLTGNRVLDMVCNFCSYKEACWKEGLQYLPQRKSVSKNPKWLWYTALKEVEDD